MDEKLALFIEEFSFLWQPEDGAPPLFQHREAAERLVRLERMHPPASIRAVGIYGKKGIGKKSLLCCVAGQLKRPVLFIDQELLALKYNEYGEEVYRILAGYSVEIRCMVCLLGNSLTKEADPERRKKMAQTAERLAQNGISCYLLMEEGSVLSEGEFSEILEITLTEPGAKERISIWEYVLENYRAEKGISAEELGLRYRLNSGQIYRIVQSAELNRISFGRECISREDIDRSVTRYYRSFTGNLARPVKKLFTMEDLVLEERTKEQLYHLCRQVKYRNLVGEQWGFGSKRGYGNGVCALFYGPPGTGKTMAAQVVAGELELDLYRVDLSQMFSKYIGETQKHISELFHWAKSSNALLLFDEADAFFSRRTQIRDANDRHANSETAHLLQQMEEYEGVSILATNLKNHMDEAFRRRIRMTIYFPLPSPCQRRLLWEKAVPSAAPVSGDIDWGFLAEHFELPGSEIKQVVMDAAFYAAPEQRQIGMEDIKKALKTCFDKYGRVLTDADFECF